MAVVTGRLEAIDRNVDLHRRKRAVVGKLFKVLPHKLMTGEIWVGKLDVALAAPENTMRKTC